jgi:hypothetical protein
MLTMTTDCVVFLFFIGFLFGTGVEEDVSRSRSNGGARDDAVSGRRNEGDEAPHRDEGMEVSDG